MKNLMQYMAHPCRSIIFADDRLLNVQITEALRAKGILAYSTADTPAYLARSLYLMSPASHVAFVITLPRLTSAWRDPRAGQVIMVSRKWAKSDASIKLVDQARGRAPGARNAVHFQNEADLYDETEQRLPFEFDELDPELQEMIYGYSFSGTPIGRATEKLRKAHWDGVSNSLTASLAEVAAAGKQAQKVFDDFGIAASAAHEQFAKATTLHPRTKSA